VLLHDELSHLLTFLSRCEATPENLDAKANLRSHEKTHFLIRRFDSAIIWDNYGVRDDVIVSVPIVVLPL
jgi:hypothetical protein